MRVMKQLTSTKRTSPTRLLIVVAIVGLVSATLIIVPRRGSAAAASFALGVPITLSGTEGNFPVIADFNGDGNADIAVTGGRSGKVSVLLGQGAGNFAAPVDIAAGDFPADMAAADFPLRQSLPPPSTLVVGHLGLPPAISTAITNPIW